MTDQQEPSASRLPYQGASNRDVSISHQRETSGSSSTDTSNLGDPNRSSSVQRGRFLVRKVPETVPVNGEVRTVGGHGAAASIGVSGEQIEKLSLPPKGAVQKGRFLVQQIASDTDKPSLARDGSGESTTTHAPTPNGIVRKNAASDQTDATMMRHDPRKTVQKGRFLVQPRQEEPAKPPTQGSQKPTDHGVAPTGTLPGIDHGASNHIPTGTLPGNQVVRERKGRFNLLEPGSVQLNDFSGNLAVPVNSAQSTNQPQVRSSQPSGGPEAIAGAAPNQQPILKKKGRFVVSNVPVQGLFANHQQVYLQQMPQQPETVAMVFAPTADGTFYASTARVDPSSQGTAPVDPSQYSSFGVPPPPPPSHPPPPLQSQGLDTPLSSVSTTTHKQFQPESPSCFPSPAVSTQKAEENAAKANHMNQQPPRQTGPDGKPNVKQRFGKMLYFLDQMRSEVTEADRNIKTLQTNMKCMRERNKELEGQVRELEKKYQHEKAAREATEAKLKALKKRVKTTRNDLGQAAAEFHVDSAQKKEESSTASCASLQPTGTVSRTNSLDGIQEIGENRLIQDNAASTKSEAGSLAPVPSTAEPGVESAPPIAKKTVTDASPPRGGVGARAGQSTSAATTVPANTATRGVARSGSESSHPRQKHRINQDGSQPIGVMHSQGIHKSGDNGTSATASSFDPLRPIPNRSQFGVPAVHERESVPVGTPFVVMNAHPTVGYLTTQEVDGASLMTFHSPVGQQGDGVANAMGNGQQGSHIPIQQSHMMPGMFVVPPRMEFHTVAPSQDMQQQGFPAHQQNMASNQSTFSSQSSQASHRQQTTLNTHHDPFDELVQTRSKSGK